MKLAEITNFLESIAPLNYQEDYDNSGLIVGNSNDEIHAALVALDCTEQIVDEAIAKNCNLIITHHPIVFKGLKKFNGKTYVERVVLKAIKNNIAFGLSEISEGQVETAAKNAAVYQNIIDFDQKFETMLGERGITLSGGQKQRVSIARAIIKNPEILLFDDCLSAVDTETEEQILNNLLQISKNKTTIIVSHRVSSAKNADKIIILDEGKIIQEGSHNQLINQEGYYAELYLKQLSEKELN